MVNQILILSFTEDAHAQEICSRLNKKFGANAHIWDTSGIPSKQTLTIDPEKHSYCLNGVHSEPIDFSKITSCWWRRPVVAEIPDDVKETRVRRYCQNESDKLIRGAILASNMPLINDPINQSAADHKPYQLRAAYEIGLKIPETLITNSPEEAKSFTESRKRKCIYKAFNSPSWKIVETREFDKSMDEDLESLKYAPVIFQEYVPLGRDIRVIAMKNRLYAAEAIARSSEAYLDWRLDHKIKWNRIILPVDIIDKINKLLNKLGLHYGSIDFRQTPEGEYVFLEINPSGQFLFLEEKGRFEITDSFCELLLNHVVC